MADFYYQTSMAISGPWLLDRSQLTELDAVITEQWKRLNEYRDKKIEREVEEALPSEIEATSLNPEKKKEKDAVRDVLRGRIGDRFQNQHKHLGVSLLLSGGKKLVASSVKEAIEHAGASDSEVHEFALDLKVADVHAQFEIDAGYNRVSCRVSPESLPESRETFASLRDWIAKHQPKRWQSKWGDLSALLWMIWIVFFSASAAVLSSKDSKSGSSYQTQAVELVKQGITATNQAKGIEALLALQTGYDPKPPPSKTPKWWLPSVGWGFLACILFSIK